jgi:hypothetical protein
VRSYLYKLFKNSINKPMTVFWVAAPCRTIALMMEAASTFETSVNFYQTSLRNHPEDSHLHTLRRGNLKSHSINIICEKFRIFFVCLVNFQDLPHPFTLTPAVLCYTFAITLCCRELIWVLCILSNNLNCFKRIPASPTNFGKSACKILTYGLLF